jgi:hypothetical protein
MSEGVTESDAGRGGFDKLAGTGAFEHAGLCGHVGGSFYTEKEFYTESTEDIEGAEKK